MIVVRPLHPDLARHNAMGLATDAELSAAIAVGSAAIPLAQRGAPNGVATLDADAKIPGAQLPALAIGETFTVVSQAAMLALVAQRGDIAVRTDLTPSGFFLLTTDVPANLADWVQITAPGSVASVNARTGAVTGLAEQSAVDAEATTRAAADTTLTANVAANATAITTKASKIRLVEPRFSPLSLSKLAMWFDASSLVGLADGAPVAALPDLSPNGRDAVQATAAAQPTFSLRGGPGGRPGIQFGIGKFLSTAAFTALVQPLTIITVASIPANNDFVYDGVAAGNRAALFAVAGAVYIYSGTSVGSSVAPGGGPTLWIAVHDAAASSLRPNGLKVLSGNTGTNTLTQLQLGQAQGGVYGFTGMISEMLVVNRLLTTAETAQVEAYLAAKYSLPVRVTIPDVVGSQGANIILPANYDPTVAAPLAIYHHGYSEDETAPTVAAEKATTIAALLAAGYLVASSYAHGNNFGNQPALNDVARLYAWVAARYQVGRVVHLSQSAGGPSGLLSYGTDQARVPSKGWAGIYPLVNLGAAHNGTGGVNFNPDINAAYTTTDAGYAAATAGHDPVLLAASTWAGKRLRYYASPGDTVVREAANTDTLAPITSTTAAESVVVACTGDHGDPSHFQPADLVSFFGRCV